jgi:apolipoprotein N-acyltransferase
VNVRWRTRRAALVTVLLLVALVASGCAEAPSEEHVIEEEPVTVAEVEGSEVPELTLTPGAEERIDLTTATVEQRGDATTIPTAAVIVAPEGTFWVYTNPEPQSFVRAEITIDHEQDGMAFLTDGPPVGTTVVSLGAAELYGAERGIGH